MISFPGEPLIESMNSHLALLRSDYCVAYRDVGEEREQGAASFEVLANSLLQGESRSERRFPGGLTAIFALYSNRMSTTCFVQDSISGSLEFFVSEKFPKKIGDDKGMVDPVWVLVIQVVDDIDQ